MNDGVSPYATANDTVVSLIMKYASDIEEIMDGDLLAYSGPLIAPIESNIRGMLEFRASKRKRLVFVLETEGGYVEVVSRIVCALRHHYPDCVEFVVPDHAFSAGTVLALSGDDVHMDYFSVLGPTDPQEVKDGSLVPAWGYVEKYNELIKKANAGKITDIEVILLQAFDQMRLQMYEHSRKLAEDLLKDWLPKYKFRNWHVTETRGLPVTASMRKLRAGQVARILSDTKRWHAHGRGLSRDVLVKVVNLRISDFGSNEPLNLAIRNFHGLLTDFALKQRFNAVLYAPGRLAAPFG